MRIAQVAPLDESVPPRQYGGTERVVSYLTEELVRQGHEVTLFASGDSVTRARLVAVCDGSLRLDKRSKDPLPYHLVMLEQVSREAASFDIIHSHVDYLSFPLARRESTPQLSTLHGRLDYPDLVPLYKEFQEMPLVSISNAQRAPLPWVNWKATVYHGLPEDLYQWRPEAGSYLAFLGRISPEKGTHRAIEISKQVGMPLKIAAKIGSADRAYMEGMVKPLIDGTQVEFVGEVKEAEKNDFLGRAYALLFPIDWPEPFGLVVIEAMACGTPVIAYRNGSVPELVEDGVTGFVVTSLSEAVQAVDRVPSIDRGECRRIFEERFTDKRMVQDYLRVYQQLLLTNEIGPAEYSRADSPYR